MAGPDPPAAVLVVAWGNPLREDDGVAWHVLDRLHSLAARPDGRRFDLVCAHQLTPDMAEPLSRAAGVVFVDARRHGTPGEVRSEKIVPCPLEGALAHSLAPEALLFLAERLYGRAPGAVLVTIAGESFGVGDALSPPVRRALPRAVRAVIRQASSCIGSCPIARDAGAGGSAADAGARGSAEPTFGARLRRLARLVR